MTGPIEIAPSILSAHHGLQREGTDAFVTSWKGLRGRIGSRYEQLSRAG